MIRKLSGLLDSVGPDHLVLDVGGVGYLVHASARLLRNLPPPGARLSLTVETVVREDAINLYGFEAVTEREWFGLLQSVQGVGAKVALALLGTLGIDEIAGAIAARDTAMLTRAPGVGRKLAERITTELKDKIPAEAALAGNAARASANGANAAPPLSRDAISALINLGYRPAEAQAAIGRASSNLGGEVPLEALIRAGLKELAP